MIIQGVLFDFDGTLTHPEALDFRKIFSISHRPVFREDVI